ncbi:hypothetical protein KAR34_06415 [bacterium]|nr:hypothetical protein [bacterium]
MLSILPALIRAFYYLNYLFPQLPAATTPAALCQLLPTEVKVENLKNISSAPHPGPRPAQMQDEGSTAAIILMLTQRLSLQLGGKR